MQSQKCVCACHVCLFMCGIWDYPYTPVPSLDERTQHFTKEITLGRITTKTIKDFETKILRSAKYVFNYLACDEDLERSCSLRPHFPNGHLHELMFDDDRRFVESGGNSLITARDSIDPGIYVHILGCVTSPE